MSVLRIVGTFPSIDPANVSAFKEVVSEAVALAKDEEGTLQYEYFMSADDTTCVVLESYASSEALLEHMSHLGALLPRLFGLGGEMRADVFGEPSPALLEAAAAFKPNVYRLLAGK